MQEIRRGDGRTAFTILHPDGRVHDMADRFLRMLAGGTIRTYAYLLVDHLRWLEAECLRADTVTMQDLMRYMGAVGAEYAGPFGRPWRTGKSVYRQSTLETAAACLKGFYVYQGSRGINQELTGQFKQSRLPTKADRSRIFLGHVVNSLPANPLRPSRPIRRHPKLPPEGARSALVEALPKARDRMVVTWLADGGFRIGELCGLHLVDLHLRESHDCGQCRSAHVHICHRETNRNQARAKTKYPWTLDRGIIVGGLVRRVSPAMIHTYFEYMTTEYPRDAEHGQLLVQLHGRNLHQPLAPVAVRNVIKRASAKLGFSPIRPHAFRHGFATEVLDAAGGNSVIARDAGGWASATTVEQIYGHVDLHDPAFVAALNHVWGAEA
ncbi:tyrosine-type recombinase/integrase [Nocardia sp. NPDC101769]|uniref:tyrosine-type recombinase/integrase n=1 Tax=Nocardia sp. NPDC101769 TaxID=3364333 RepID=UPI00382FB602